MTLNETAGRRNQQGFLRRLLCPQWPMRVPVPLICGSDQPWMVKMVPDVKHKISGHHCPCINHSVTFCSLNCSLQITKIPTIMPGQVSQIWEAMWKASKEKREKWLSPHMALKSINKKIFF